MWFALHKEHRKLDRVGTGSREQFHNVPYAALREFLEYELHHNALFCVGNTILEQIRGVAIGGTCSAQLSSIFTMVQEHRFYSKPWAAQKSLINQHFPIHMVPTKPFRFRDNLVGQGFALQHLSAIQSFFEKLYTLKLQGSCASQRGGGGGGFRPAGQPATQPATKPATQPATIALYMHVCLKISR